MVLILNKKNKVWWQRVTWVGRLEYLIQSSQGQFAEVKFEKVYENYDGAYMYISVDFLINNIS